ncbi:MAG TPA: WG repeat-containing protein, partial [Clostridia bacterium]|nr:WG repeat-containing protein [Clostridia bacterium]
FELFIGLGGFRDSAERALNLSPLQDKHTVFAFMGDVAWFRGQNGMHGLLSREGRVLIPPQFEGVRFWFNIDSSGDWLARGVIQDSQYIINSKGEIIHDQITNRFSSFVTDGLIGFVNKDDKCGFIDTKGNVIIEPVWDGIGEFKNGLTYVLKDGKYGVINTRGELVTECVWDDAWPTNYGMIAVKKDDKWGIINTQSEVVMELVWDDIGFINDQFVCVKLNDRWGILTVKGAVVLELEWTSISMCSNEIFEVNKNTKNNYQSHYYLIQNETITELKWAHIDPFFEGLASVKVNEKWGYINTHGRLVVRPIWEEAGPFREGLAPVKQGGKWGYIDTQGRLVIQPVWDLTGGFSEGLAMVIEDKRRGYINPQGEVVIWPFYKESSFAQNKDEFLGFFKGGYVKVGVGYINTRGEIVFPRTLLKIP